MWHVWVRRGGCIGSWWGNWREGDHWGDLGVDGWIILRWISRRWDVGIWTGLGWPRIETGGSHTSALTVHLYSEESDNFTLLYQYTFCHDSLQRSFSPLNDICHSLQASQRYNYSCTFTFQTWGPQFI